MELYDIPTLVWDMSGAIRSSNVDFDYLNKYIDRLLSRLHDLYHFRYGIKTVCTWPRPAGWTRPCCVQVSPHRAMAQRAHAERNNAYAVAAVIINTPSNYYYY